MSIILLDAVPGGGYISIFKCVVVLLVLLAWARLLSWADEDALAAHMPRFPLNIGNLFGMVLAFTLFFLTPSFWLGLPLLILIFAGEAAIFLHLRNKVVGLGDLRRQFDNWVKGIKSRTEKKVVPDAVAITTKSGQPVIGPPRESPDRPAYEAVQFALSEPLIKDCERIDMAPSASGVSVKYAVDGVTYDGSDVDGTAGAGAISLLKGYAGLDVEERRKPQSGSIKVAVDGQKKELKIQTSGTRDGEQLTVLVNAGKRQAFGLADLGLNEAQLEIVRESIKEPQGLVLLSAPRGQGLTSLLYGILRGHDAFLTHIQTIERDMEAPLEGITQNKLSPTATPEEERNQVDWLSSQEPDVIAVSKLEASPGALDLIQFVGKGRKAYVALRAASVTDAIDRWRKLVGDDQVALQHLTMVISGRVLRKLCAACKVAYAPEAAKLRQLGMNPEKVTELYQAREQPLLDNKGRPVPCDFCKDLRFKGRTGVFEVLTVDAEVRDAIARDIASTGKPGPQLKAAFRKRRAKYLQEEALALVQQGLTSVQEVLRVLRGEGEASKPAAAAPATAGAAAPRPAAKRSKTA